MSAPKEASGLPQPCQTAPMDPVTECLLRHTRGGWIYAWFMLDGREVPITFAEADDAAFDVFDKYRARAG